LRCRSLAFGLLPIAELQKDHELRTNVMAAYIGAGTPDKALALAMQSGVDPTTSAAVSYELAYNTACALVDANRTEAAAKALDNARSMCCVLICFDVLCLIDCLMR
jgi:hypothetical protein